MEVFADFECPQCRIFFLTTTRQVIDSYVSTGKVYLIHHDFPLPMHKYSRDAARWANAAAAVGTGTFETVETALYTKQDDWGATGKIESVLAAVLSPADMKKVNAIQAAEGATIDAAIARDMALGTTRHVNATPSIYITHAGTTTPLPPGGVNYPLLKQYFDYLLSKK
jgi:protein-disulfide isomerase